RSTLLGASALASAGTAVSCSFSELDVTLPLGAFFDAHLSSNARDLQSARAPILPSTGRRATNVNSTCPSACLGTAGIQSPTNTHGGGGGGGTSAAAAAAAVGPTSPPPRRSGPVLAVGVMAMGVFELQAG
ncbi:hypothetical protein Vretifemale_5177, partial [Volvox reticuliferus]